jgi:hypothetical protein
LTERARYYFLGVAKGKKKIGLLAIAGRGEYAEPADTDGAGRGRLRGNAHRRSPVGADGEL